MEAIGSAAAILELISFTGEVLVAGYGYLSRLHKAPAEIRSLLKGTANINALLDQLQTLVTEDCTPHAMGALETLVFHGVLKDCRSLMETILRSIKACEHMSGRGARGLGRRVLWPFKERETNQTLQQLGRLRETISAAVAVDSTKTLVSLEGVAKMIDSNVISILQVEATLQVQIKTLQTAEDVSLLQNSFLDRASAEENAAVYGWLLPDDVDINTNFEAALNLRHPSTGQWLLSSKTFQDWLNSEMGRFWVHGFPGCGKTVLSATVVEYLQTKFDQKQDIVLHFFCSHRDPKKQKLENCLGTFSKQLLDMSPKHFNYARNQYLERLHKSQGHLGTLAKLSVEEHIKLIQQFCLQVRKVAIVVDALDECADRRAFLHGLLKLTEESPAINLFLTSRYEVDLERLISPVATHHIALKDHMKSDIQTYLYAEATARVDQGSLKLRHESLLPIIIAALEEKADGMILIAKLHLDYLCGLKSDRSIKEALHKLPTGINATYDEILHQLCTQQPEYVEEIKLILRWLIGSLVPLTLDQLAEAVSIRPSQRRLDRDGVATDPMDLAASCGSLVTVFTQEAQTDRLDSSKSTTTMLISLSHTSVEEYLTSSYMKSGPLNFFYTDLEDVHRDLSETCLQYIGFEDFKIPLTPSYPDVNGDGWQQMLKKRMSQFVLYDYVCAYWDTHLSLSLSDVDARIMELLTWFLAAKQNRGLFESWQQMYHQDIKYYCRGRPPLYYALEFEIPRLIEVLLPQEHEINTLNLGMTALHEAAKWGDVATCKTLLDRGALIDLKSSRDTRGMNALHFAAENGHLDVIKLLLARGADPQCRSRSLATPLYRAARFGSLSALIILCAAGGDINACTFDNWTPLYEAVVRGHVNISKQLLEWGADPTIMTDTGKSVLTLISEATGNDLDEDMRMDLYPKLESPLGTKGGGKGREAMILQGIQKLEFRLRHFG